MTLAEYELLDAEKAHHSIARRCAWLARSGCSARFRWSCGA
ncbi:cytosine/adenosine deaminase-related metal-dependent hydrolase [Streptosporangium becharense]|uniref:Cytosine/adenosine deaminase-related metal-dependent hydrolase n=1 Tax=Streptosporangium becharense TaxID=1816182 RepID=A0A7W9MK27_9ACTN|nr:cytosine/adenosine deaminase-related metal-dependent hydrolase [Streptosporangium becharense]MBB5823301.1 cytosine/adenosine deaminase-related metal-dependent hydrolase [Streptosporangium becharense]